MFPACNGRRQVSPYSSREELGQACLAFSSGRFRKCRKGRHVKGGRQRNGLETEKCNAVGLSSPAQRSCSMVGAGGEGSLGQGRCWGRGSGECLGAAEVQSSPPSSPPSDEDRQRLKVTALVQAGVQVFSRRQSQPTRQVWPPACCPVSHLPQKIPASPGRGREGKFFFLCKMFYMRLQQGACVCGVWGRRKNFPPSHTHT